MVLIDQLWDDVIAGPQPENGLSKLRKVYTRTGGEGSSIGSSKYQRSLSMPTSPPTPGTPGTPTNLTSPSATAKKENVWWSVFHPGSNQATKNIGGEMFDNAAPNSPTVYDWLYSDKTRSKHR